MAGAVAPARHARGVGPARPSSACLCAPQAGEIHPLGGTMLTSSSGRRRAFSPRLEALEDRTLPSTFTVLNLNDSGAGSLRAAVAAANANPGHDTIAFRPGLSGTITLRTGQLTLTDDVTIDGPGALRLAVSGNDQSRVFEVS